MKYTIHILLILIQFSSIGQDEMDFPYDVKFDPLDHKLKLLKVKKIEQISKHCFYSDSSNIVDTNYTKFNLDYVFTYDSNVRLVSMKYNFLPEFDMNIPSDGGPVQIEIHNAESELYKFAPEKDSSYYNYYEKEFIYNNGEIEVIKIHKPLRWIIDGVYLVENIIERECIENTYDDDLLVKKEIYWDGRLSWIIEYFYKTFTVAGREIKLLDCIIEKNESKIQNEIKIYYFL